MLELALPGGIACNAKLNAPPRPPPAVLFNEPPPPPPARSLLAPLLNVEFGDAPGELPGPLPLPGNDWSTDVLLLFDDMNRALLRRLIIASARRVSSGMTIILVLADRVVN